MELQVPDFKHKNEDLDNASGEFSRGLFIDPTPQGGIFKFEFKNRFDQTICLTIGNASILSRPDAFRLAQSLARRELMKELENEVFKVSHQNKLNRIDGLNYVEEHNNQVGSYPLKNTDYSCENDQTSTLQQEAVSNSFSSLYRKSDRSNIRLSQFINEYYLPHIKHYKRTTRSEISIIKNHIVPSFGEYFLSDIQKNELIFFFNQKLKTLKPGTVNRILNGFKVIFNKAIEFEIEGIEKNPLKGIKQFKDLNRREYFLSKQQAQNLIDASLKSKNRSLYLIISALLLTGCRKREILDARWEDLDLDRGILIVPISKSGKPRNVYLSKRAIEVFKMARFFLEGEMGEFNEKQCPWIFANPATGRPYTGLFKAWDRVRKEINLKHFRLHDLRHSFASALVNSGGTLYEAQKLLGHSNAQMTERYAHLANDRLVNVASKVSQHYFDQE